MRADRPEEEPANPARPATMRAARRPEEARPVQARLATMRAACRPEEEPANLG